MLFQQIYNWLKFKTIPTSVIFKNRLFIERDLRKRKIMTNLGLTFRSSKWLLNSKKNIHKANLYIFNKIFITLVLIILAVIYYKILFFMIFLLFFNSFSYFWFFFESYSYYLLYIIWIFSSIFLYLMNLIFRQTLHTFNVLSWETLLHERSSKLEFYNIIDDYMEANKKPLTYMTKLNLIKIWFIQTLNTKEIDNKFFILEDNQLFLNWLILYKNIFTITHLLSNFTNKFTLINLNIANFQSFNTNNMTLHLISLLTNKGTKLGLTNPSTLTLNILFNGTDFIYFNRLTPLNTNIYTLTNPFTAFIFNTNMLNISLNLRSYRWFYKYSTLHRQLFKTLNDLTRTLDLVNTSFILNSRTHNSLFLHNVLSDDLTFFTNVNNVINKTLLNSNIKLFKTSYYFYILRMYNLLNITNLTPTIKLTQTIKTNYNIKNLVKLFNLKYIDPINSLVWYKVIQKDLLTDININKSNKSIFYDFITFFSKFNLFFFNYTLNFKDIILYKTFNFKKFKLKNLNPDKVDFDALPDTAITYDLLNLDTTLFFRYLNRQSYEFDILEFEKFKFNEEQSLLKFLFF